MQVKKIPGKHPAKTSPLAVAGKAGNLDVPPDIGSNLRRLRHRNGHSLDALARISGVSRAMLGQIETGKSMPTVTVAWKIASALGIPVAALVDQPRAPQCLVLRNGEGNAVVLGESGMTWKLLHSADPRVDLCEIRLAPDHRQTLPAGTPGSRTSLIVSTGSLEIAIGNDIRHRLLSGDSILFESDVEHTYLNPGSHEAVAYLLIAPAKAALSIR